MQIHHRSRVTLASLLAVLVVLLAACGPLGSSPSEPTTASTPEQNAAQDNPDTTGETFTGELTFVGSTTVQPLAEKLGAEFVQRHPDVVLDIGAGGSVVGIQAVQGGDVDIGMASRRVDDEEKTPGMEVHQIAVDVLAVIVHPSNPVDNLTREELRAIYLGEITNWSEVGGNDEPILPVIREVTSGTRGAFDEIVLDDEEPTSTADTQITASEVEARVANTENAIGYIGFGHIEEEIKVLTIDGIEPLPETALDDSYQLQRPLQLLTGPLSRELSHDFIEFVLSEEGQNIVAEDGWVPVQASRSE